MEIIGGNPENCKPYGISTLGLCVFRVLKLLYNFQCLDK